MKMSALEIIESSEAPPLLALTPEEVAALADELVHYQAAFAELYSRKEQAHWGYTYLQGLMLPIERQSIEPLALALDGGDVQAMQQCIGQGQWQEAALWRQHWALVDETLGEADGVGIVDGSAFPKQGEHSVGVARQWCGRLGKVENGEAGGGTAYASRNGYTRLDRRLYLPDEWFDAAHRERWHTCGVPEDTPFKTKPTLALEMLQAVVQAGTGRFHWVTGDAAFGREPTFLDGVAALPRGYDAEMPHDTRVWRQRPATAVPAGVGRGRRPGKVRLVPGEPAPPRVDQLARALPPDAWQRYRSTAGSKGLLVAACAFQRRVAVRAGLPGPDVCIVFRRAVGEQPELNVYLSHAPAHTPVTVLVRVAGMRWPIETAFEESTGGLGLDHYEVRSWRGWHQHLTLCLLAHHFLVRARLRVKRGRPRSPFGRRCSCWPRAYP
jgi:SRSO17 transposase